MYIEIDYKVVSETGYGDYLKKLRTYVTKELNSHCIKKTKYSIKFIYKGLRVDLLFSPYWRTKSEFYSSLEELDEEQRRM